MRRGLSRSSLVDDSVWKLRNASPARSTARCAISSEVLRLGCVALAFISPLCAADSQQIRGAVVDVTGAAIEGASVRLLNSDSEEVIHATADASGKFQMGSAGADSYVLKAGQPGFRSRRVPVGVHSETETIDVGDIRLDIAGCDAPGVICDWFGEAPPPDPVVSRNNLRVQMDCMLAFTMGKAFCTSETKEPRQTDADVQLSLNENGVYLTAMNGASLAAPNLPSADCRDAYPKESKIRIDGLGPGDDICLYTHDQHWSHVFLTSDVSRSSRQIAVWQITRKR